MPFWPENAKDWATIVQAAFTVVAIVVAALLGYLRFGWFRTIQPHASISHKITDRSVSNRYLHLAIEVTVVNTSKVVIGFRDGFISVQHIAPTTDKDVKALSEAVLKDPTRSDMQWELSLWWQPLTWEQDAFMVEPGETEV